MNTLPSDLQLAALSEQVAKILTASNLHLATAESCTGGWLAKLMTDLAGSSAWFECGFVTYSNASKQDMLAVSPSMIEKHGAVSEQTVEAMAQGALDNSHAQLSVAISGIAGPSGAMADKPVGTVWFAWADKRTEPAKISSESCYFAGDREAVRRQAVAHAMEGILALIE